MLTSLVLALSTIARNRLRAGLTVLGILIGVAALIAVTSLAMGVSASISKSMSSFAANALTISPDTPPSNNRATIPRKLTEADGRAVLASHAVSDIAPILTSRIQVIYGDTNESTTAMGTTLGYFRIRHSVVANGSLWNAGEEARKEKVCVLGATIKEHLFGAADPVGRLVRIGHAPYRVLGVLTPLGSPPTGGDPDNLIYMPIGGFRARIRATSPGQTDGVLVAASTSAERTKTQITSIMRQRHRIREGAAPDFVVTSPDELQKLQVAIAAALSALLICVAGVSLIVGGIGVMNIMLVSVAERTREIGIRLSIGARSTDILMQFLIEAIVLSLTGGALGLLLGIALSYGMGALVKLDLSPSPLAALVAIVSSGTIGVVFGLLPARRASRLDPIQALRTD